MNNLSLKSALKTLDLKSGASFNEAKIAYRDLMLVWHPDKYQQNPRLSKKSLEKTKELNNAFDYLSDISKMPDYRFFCNNNSRAYTEKAYNQDSSNYSETKASNDEPKYKDTPKNEKLKKKGFSFKTFIWILILVSGISKIHNSYSPEIIKASNVIPLPSSNNSKFEFVNLINRLFVLAKSPCSSNVLSLTNFRPILWQNNKSSNSSLNRFMDKFTNFSNYKILASNNASLTINSEAAVNNGNIWNLSLLSLANHDAKLVYFSHNHSIRNNYDSLANYLATKGYGVSHAKCGSLAGLNRIAVHKIIDPSGNPAWIMEALHSGGSRLGTQILMFFDSELLSLVRC